MTREVAVQAHSLAIATIALAVFALTLAAVVGTVVFAGIPAGDRANQGSDAGRSSATGRTAETGRHAAHPPA
ncbi:hypothetical protein CFP65_3393 [Kitasatospora sp. MMS16-BH015]|uniref:hypothetical protein n=1 Tax=Kitasatospora sp. MMS16-BH015 TaxID=2018025 RepID=UPI000CA15A6C|nr:hypothetical protein [Kitasatospora sp. MMS16-BH015]AUG78189.1 hypothetical protein CFP65_3393 [Kitasatospora sp. MMS16-BH015]